MAVYTCPDAKSLVPCSGIVTGIYTTSTPEACQYIAHDCRANVIVVDTQKQLEKILKVWGEGTAGVGVKAGRRHGPPACRGLPVPLVEAPYPQQPPPRTHTEQGRAVATYPFARSEN